MTALPVLHWTHPRTWVRRLLRRQVRRPRVLHLLSSLDVGGMEQFVVRIARRQKERGSEVGVLALRGGPLESKARSAGLFVFTLAGLGLARRILNALLVANRFAPDVIHVHNTTSLQYGALCSVALGCPYLMTFHGQGSGSRNTSRFEWGSVSAVVAVSVAASHKVAAKVAPDRLVVIPNGIETQAQKGLRNEKRGELGLGAEPVAVMVARMDGLKGHVDLLEALALMRDAGAKLTVLLVGDGAKRSELEKRSMELGLDDRWVRFLGYRSDVPDLLECSDIFVLPSLTEGMPLSVLEAMAAGLPVVASNVGGIPELVTHGREGLLVPPAQPQELFEALREATGNPAFCRTMGDVGRARVEARFSFESMLDRYDELYRAVLK